MARKKPERWVVTERAGGWWSYRDCLGLCGLHYCYLPSRRRIRDLAVVVLEIHMIIALVDFTTENDGGVWIEKGAVGAK